ncbi:formylglycine-generating enzyme family protein [Acanthopleuribacter pedis]|uniref:formylglycine-generating enzyme family protein n=1 Tax=Acanthopleuribacter pedis TaxID=442870 RepID=UPI00311CCFC9
MAGARAETETPFSFGERIDTAQVNFDGRYRYRQNKPDQIYRDQVVSVKDLPCNPWGLYQMHGNVLEWCADWYGSYDPQDGMNPVGAAGGGKRVVRGGSFSNGARICRSAYRGASAPGSTWQYQGFRPAGGS